MPGYCHKAGQRFQHNHPHKQQDQPYPHTACTYGAKQQYVDDPDQSPPLNKQDKTFVQEVVGVFLYYARAVDCTMLTALSSLTTQQANPTKNTLQQVNQFLDYAMTHQDASISYRASNMILAVHSDASYLSETKARHHAGGHFFLSENDDVPRNNDAILTIAQMSSDAEAELGALYIAMHERLSHSGTCKRNWDIHNHQRPSKSTTQQHSASSPTSSNPNEPTSHGYEIPLVMLQNKSKTVQDTGQVQQT
jgi:hypothetical protein